MLVQLWYPQYEHFKSTSTVHSLKCDNDVPGCMTVCPNPTVLLVQRDNNTPLHWKK